MYLFVYSRTPLYPPPNPRLVYRDRPITEEAYKNVSECVCVLGGGGWGAYKRKFMVFGTVKHSQFKEQRTETQIRKLTTDFGKVKKRQNECP